MDVLKSQTADGVRKELLVFALVYNLVCVMMCEAAAAWRVLAARISFVDAWRALAFASHGHPATVVLVTPHRPGRIEPRVRKRRPKESPLMTQPRATLRKALLAQDDTG